MPPGHADRDAASCSGGRRGSGFHPREARAPEPNQLVVKLDPSTGVKLIVEAHRADEPNEQPIHLDMEFSKEGGEGPAPYEVLLLAALRGDSMRFTRQDGVEEAWRIMRPLLENHRPSHPYAKGSWGPAAADALVADVGGWHGPWVAS